MRAWHLRTLGCCHCSQDTKQPGTWGYTSPCVLACGGHHVHFILLLMIEYNPFLCRSGQYSLAPWRSCS